MNRYPHTATLSYLPINTQGTYNTLGVYTPATASTLGIFCNIQSKSNGYLVGTDGNNISYAFDVFGPAATVAGDRFMIEFFGKKKTVLNPDDFQGQYRWQIKC